jgi:hypothetical protein
MATDTADGRSGHVRSMTVTTVAAIGGIVAAFLSWTVATSVTDSTAAGVVVAAVVIEMGVMRAVGLVEELGAKKVLFIAFMTFSLWFVCSTILLTAGVFPRLTAGVVF